VPWTWSVELLSHANMSPVVLLASAFLLALFFAYMYMQKRQEYLLVWSAGWLLIALHFISHVAGPPATSAKWFDILDEWLLAVAALAFYASARLYARLALQARWVILAVAAAAVWALAYAQHWFRAPLGLGVALLFFMIARTFSEEGRKQESRADLLLSIAFVVWGFLRLATVFQEHLGPLAKVDLIPLVLLPELFSGVLMVMAVYEEERRRVERNMVALTNLNLATSTFVGGEIQKMLAQALDRVLIACAEHELNASTFAARVIASTGADLFASVLSALCSLSGPIHGGACDRIEAMFAELETGARVDDCLAAFTRDHRLPPGFGHAIYPDGDPRAALLRQVAQTIAKRRGRKLFEMAQKFENAVSKRERLRPNLDFYLTVCVRMLGFQRSMPAAIFAIGRASGWIAHALEQYADNRLIRPRMRYRGAPLRHWD